MRLFLCWLAMAGPILSCFAILGAAFAQAIAPDGTLPTNVSSPDGLNFTITGGSQAGGNLFHSFSQFSVPTTGSAVFDFDAMAGIQTIIGRVTGGSPSVVDGLISTTSAVHLFLLNPSGILFGPNASLNIGGSFIASTAHSLRFADGTEFNASAATATPLLTLSVPIGLQYNGQAAPIHVQAAALSVDPHQTLALVGGDVVMSGGTLQAPDGRIELGGVDAGSVGLNPAPGLNSPGGQWQLTYPAVARSNVSLTNGALVTTSGDGGGNIQLVGKQLTVQDSRMEANTFGTVAGSRLIVNATDSVFVTSSRTSGEFAQGLFAENYGDGTASGLLVTANQLVVQGEARLSTSTYGAGHGGDVTVDVVGATEMQGVRSTDPTLFTGLVADTYGTGAGGNLTVNTGQLRLRDGAQISAVANGTASAGALTVHAIDSIDLIGADSSDTIASGLFTAVAETGEAGRAGNISVHTRRLSIRDGAQIFAGTGSSSNGGDVTIQATERVEVSGVSPVFRAPGGIFSAANPGSTGEAGDVTIHTRQLIVRDGANIAVGTLGLGQGGRLEIFASDSVQLIGQGPLRDDPLNPGHPIPTFSSLSASVLNAANTQNSGDVSITTNGTITIQAGARITVDNEGTGRGGNITLQARSLLLNNLDGDPTNPGGIRAVTVSGEGGNISLLLRDVLLMQAGSLISTDAASGSGNGGNINIRSTILAAFNNSDITANAVQGRGGNIQIDAKAIIGTQFRPALTPDSDITASSRFGASGVVEIRTPDVDPTRGAVTLPVQLVDATKLVAEGCRINSGEESSRFTITGRGGLPPSPEGILGSDAVVQDLRTTPIGVRVDRSSTAIERSMAQSMAQMAQPIAQSVVQPMVQPSNEPVEAQGLVRTSQGEIFLATQVSSVSPSSLWFAPLSCNGH